MINAIARLRGSGTGSLLLIFPAMALLILLFFYPLAILLLTTLHPDNIENYASVVGSGTYMQVFLNTLRLAAIVTVIDLAIAYPLAFYMCRLAPGGRAVAFFLLLIPLWTSQLVRTYAWMVLLGRNGPINGALMGLGLIDAPLRLSNGEFAVVIGMVHILLPYMVLPIVSVRSDCPARVKEWVIVSTMDSGHLEVGDGGEEGSEEAALV